MAPKISADTMLIMISIGEARSDEIAPGPICQEIYQPKEVSTDSTMRAATMAFPNPCLRNIIYPIAVYMIIDPTDA
jgi:hypothetical protein